MALPFLIATLALTGASIYQSERAADKQDEASKVQERIADIRAQRQRRQQVAQLRRVRAENLVTAQTSGTRGSSSVAGATGAATTQTASNINFLTTTRELGAEIAGLQRGARRAQANAQLFSTAATYTNQAFQDKGGFKKLFEGDADATT